MRRHAILFTVSSICIFAFLALSTLSVAGTPAYQLDPTDQQATVDAIVEQRFTQTAIAITEAPAMPTTISTVAPTPIPTLTLMPTMVAEGSVPFFAGSLNAVFTYTVDEDVFDEYQDGWEEYFGRDYDDAIDAFSDAIDENPDFAEAYYGRAISHFGNSDYDDALEDIAIFETMVGRINQEMLLSRVFAYANTGQDDLLIQTATQLLATPPYDYFAIEILMQTHFDNEDYEQVIAVADAMSPFFYSIADFFDLRHDAYDELGDDANADYNDLMHDGIDDLNNNDVDDAEDNLEEAIELAQDENLDAINLAVAYYNLGFLNFVDGNFDEGVEFLEDAIEADPTFGASYVLLGVFNNLTGDDDNAIDYFSAGIETSPNFALNYIERAIVSQEVDDTDTVILDTMQWLQLTQRHALQWNIDLNEDSILLPLFPGWSHRFTVELNTNEAINIDIEATQRDDDPVTSFVVILDPTGTPVTASVPRSSGLGFTDLRDYTAQQAGEYTIIIGNAGEGEIGLIEVEIEID